MAFVKRSQLTGLSAALYVQEQEFLKYFSTKFSSDLKFFYAIIKTKRDFFFIYNYICWDPSGGTEALTFQALVSTAASAPSRY